MRFLLAEDFWALDLLNPFEWHLLAKLPETAAGDGFPSEASERLYPPPLSDDTLASEETVAMAEDWSEFVRPEIEGRFESDRLLVAGDLAGVDWIERADGESPESQGAEEEGDDEEPEAADARIGETDPDERTLPGERYGRVTVSADHTDAWYSTLNQARILMHEAHRIADAEERSLIVRQGREEGESELAEEIDRERLYLVAQYEFYSALQSLLVEHAMEP